MKHVSPRKDLYQQAEVLRSHSRKLRGESDQLIRYLKKWLHTNGLNSQPVKLTDSLSDNQPLPTGQ